MKKLFVGLIACGIAVMMAVPAMALVASQTNYAWYVGHEGDSSYTIATAGDMNALARLVNGTADTDGDGKADAGPVDFAGKTISVADPLNVTKQLNFVAEGIEPIGTAAHPFKGTFDGNGFTADNFKLVISASDTTTPVSNVGLFGYVGEGGSVSNIGVGSLSQISIERAATSKDYITNVGMVVGYCAGSVANCSNAGTLTVTSAVAQKSAADHVPVRNVGGVVGQCVFDVSGCTNSGSVNVSETASPDADIAHGQLATRIGGVAGLEGDESRVGTYNNHIYGEADKHGAVSGCTNTGKLVIDTPQIGAKDRFGQQTNAESFAVGGVVGYSQGSVTACVNGREKAPEMGASDRDAGYVRAENGVQVGGVCGSLRGVLSDNMNTAYADDGADGMDPLVIEDCTNYGDVYARATAGGVVGKTSSYTTVTECLNLNKSDALGNEVESFVIATRWNKPAPGGIVGTATGEVSYCANLATVASAKWKDETSRTLDTQDGYYAAGIAGMLVYFDKSAADKGGVTTPVSEIFGCYNAGTIVAGAGMRQRGIAGQNDGYVHDNVLLEDVVADDKIVYGDSAEDKEASGTTANNKVFKAENLRGDASSEAVALLNENSPANGWSRYWVVSRDAQAQGLNAGFPLLDRQDPWGDAKVSIAGASLTLKKDAAYTGGASTPSVDVKLGGKALVANVDYYVAAQEGATETTNGARPYVAHVVGIGRYAGTSTAGVNYGITAGDFSTCTVTVATHTFDYSVQVPAADEVAVRTPAGTSVPADTYTFEVVDSDGDQVDAVNADSYRLLLTPTAGSGLFTGELEGTFVIKAASFMQDVDFGGAQISYLGTGYPWVDSTKSGESDNPSTTLPYTGVPVMPDVSGVSYKGHVLEEGKDYKVVYGNPNSDDGNSNSEEADNRGRAGGTAKGWVTVRYLTGVKTNFSSYANMCFNITDDGGKIDLANASPVLEGGAQIADGMAHRPVKLVLGRADLTEGVDYTIDYADNVSPGTATWVATGIGKFAGQIEGSFEIEAGELLNVLYSYSGAGTAAEPFEATVTGAEYFGNRDTFSLVIPDSVEHGGETYRVTAIGEKAFGGSGSADFAGSDAAESKSKLASVYVPAGVRTLGRFAFGSAWESSDLALSSVEFAQGSELAVIDEYAFARCGKLGKLTVPEQVATIARAAFYKAGLSELRFLTTSASLPSDVAEGAVRGAFRECSGVTVYGYASAAAVKAIADGNSGTTSGTNAGKNFTFKQLNSMQSAEVPDIADQVYTGDAIEPSVRVSLGGKRLVKDVDYEVVYANNVNAGTAHVIVKGIGTWGGQIEKTFSIEPAKMARVEVSSLPDKVYDGQAASYAPRLTYAEHRLAEGFDYALSYATADGTPLDEAPSAAGTYRLVATALDGNFTGSCYRSFRIVQADLADADVSVGQQDYTGTPIEPDPTVRLGGAYLERDRDYVLSYSGNVELGTATVRVRGIGAYSGEQSAPFRIVGSSLEEASVVGVGDVEATGQAVAFEPVVIYGGRLLTEGSDYTLAYQKAAEAGALSAATAGGLGAAATGVAADKWTDLDAAPSAPGSYRLVVRGAGNCRSSASAEFEIVEGAVAGKTSLSAASVAVQGDPVAYDGSALTPELTVSLGGTELEAGRDYVAAYSDNVSPSSSSAPAKVDVYGTGAYSGVAHATFSVSAVELTAANVEDVAGAHYLGGDAVAPALVVRANGRSLSEGTDYTVEFSNNVGVGEATAVITGLKGYSGTVEKRFDIARADVARASVEVADRVYDGSEHEPAVTVTMDGHELGPDDFDVDYENNTDAGKASVIVKGKGNYDGTTVGQFTIAPHPLGGDDCRVFAGAQTYSGYALEPEVSVRVGDVFLGAADFSVAYSDNVNAGMGKATVTGLGNYSGTVVQPFAINPISLSGAVVSVAGATYTGRALTPPATVTLGGTALGAGDYKLVYSNNVNAGRATVAAVGTGNYSGTATATFDIAAADLSRAAVSVGNATYSGSALEPAVAVRFGGRTLTKGTDFSVAYSNNVNATTAGSKAGVTVTGIGNYRGTATASFDIAQAAPVLKVKTTSKRVKASAAKKKAQKLKLKVTSPSKGKLTWKVKKANKRISFKKGKATLKKGTKKGTYSVKVTLTQAASGNYAQASKTLTVKFKVK